MEATRYRRGLEGELGRTISSLNNVKGARVHGDSEKLGIRARRASSPALRFWWNSIGASAGAEPVMAIINTVATSVPELNKSQITVVDQKGNLLSDQQELTELSMAGKQFDYSRRMESLYTQRVHNILQPVLGGGRYKAEVSADVDFSAVESTSETFSPDQPALRSEQSVNEQRQSSLPPQGVPGALSNQPPGPASAPEQANQAAAAAGAVAPGQPLVDANGQQIMDPVTGQPMLAPFRQTSASRPRAITSSTVPSATPAAAWPPAPPVAVVVDDQMSLNAAGEMVRVPWNADDLARFTRLVQDAVGFDASRGDSVSVINTAFVADSFGETFEEIPFYSQPRSGMSSSGCSACCSSGHGVRCTAPGAQEPDQSNAGKELRWPACPVNWARTKVWMAAWPTTGSA